MRTMSSFLVFVISAGCMGESSVDVFTEEEFEMIKTLGPLPDIPLDPTNRYADNPAAAAFGQRLFYEKGYAHALTIADPALGDVGEKGKISCASCHDPSNYYTDTRSRPNATSLGVSWTIRNTPTLVNAVFYTWGSWGGKDDTQWHQGANGSESSNNFASNRLEFSHLIYRKYRADYDALFPIPLDPALDPAAPDAARFPPNGRPKSSSTAPDGPWEMMAAADRDHINTILANTGKALAAFERQLVSRNAPIDRYIAGDYSALSNSAKRGLKLFIGKAACIDCHSGPQMSDQKFHNTGVPQIGPNLPRTDNGRYDDLARTLPNAFNAAGKYSDNPEMGSAKLAGMELTDDLKGQFRTSMLRQIDRTGPYMHTGALSTLEEVVRFYNVGGGDANFAGTKSAAMTPLLLSPEEQGDLVEFLRSLTGEPLPTEYARDTSIPD
jgi:cytochrome c peroxidase